MAYLFTQQCEILLAPLDDEEAAIEVAIEAGAQDIGHDNDQMEIITPAETYRSVLSALEKANIEVDQSQLAMRAQTTVFVDKETEEQLNKLIDTLEDLDDVQSVYSNAQ